MRARPGTMLIFTVAILVSGVLGYDGFKITGFAAPEHVPISQHSFDLSCEYHGDITILSWYKGPKEFFRFVPMKTPGTATHRLFAVPGIDQVQIEKCEPGICHLKIGNITPDATGLYRCDIERATPPYSFDSRTGYVEVEEHQPRVPVLMGVKQYYTEGELIRAYCRGETEKEIRWFINAKEIKNNQGVPALSHLTTRSLFIGDQNPSITIQCAESKNGKLIVSNELKAFWKNPENNYSNFSKKREPHKLLTKCLGIIVTFIYLIIM